MTAANADMRRGSPLAMIMVVMVAWVGVRAVTWENPFPLEVGDLLGAGSLFAAQETRRSHAFGEADLGEMEIPVWGASESDIIPAGLVVFSDGADQEGFRAYDDWRGSAFAHQTLWLQASAASFPRERGAKGGGAQARSQIKGVTPISPPFGNQPKPDRWSVDGWAFWRQGSNAAQISQGRVPIYGASQIGANLQYRAAPASAHDPRIFFRAYRALVSGGETELAAGLSARPIGSIPVRVAAELRATENRFGTELRPAAFAVTELAPQTLPANFNLEAYGGAGYVGGDDATAFADGQMTVTREVAEFEGPAVDSARVSIGGGAWGGAQQGASRVDVGPTVRVDLTIGTVPARIAVDWRERVGGDASPDSGVAATLSTRF